MFLNIINKFKFSLILFSLILYFFGFYIREISNGAGHLDGHGIWILINDLKKNFYITLLNYLNYEAGSFPFYHIIQKIFNPWIEKKTTYFLSNTIFNLCVPLIFIYFLKKKIRINTLNCTLISSIFLLSPWFRSSSFWGQTENLALIFLIPSCFYFSEILYSKNDLKKNIYLCIWVSLTIYTRQQFIFLPIFHVFISVYNYKNWKNIIYITILYFIFSVPGSYVLYLWGFFSDIKNSTSNANYISFKFIFNNIPIISSIIFFYILPILLTNIKYIFNKYFNLKNFLIFFFILLFKYFLFSNFNYPTMGGGFVIKICKIILNNNIMPLIFCSSMMFLILIEIFRSKNYHLFFILFLIYIIIGLCNFIYQEWFDPSFIVFIFIFLSNKLIIRLNIISLKNIFIFYFYELIILIVAIIYYHNFLKIPLFTF